MLLLPFQALNYWITQCRKVTLHSNMQPMSIYTNILAVVGWKETQTTINDVEMTNNYTSIP